MLYLRALRALNYGRKIKNWTREHVWTYSNVAVGACRVAVDISFCLEYES